MPIRSFKFVPKDVVEWGRFFRSTLVEPSDGSIVDEQFADREATSVIGRSANTDGTPADIIAGADNRFLMRRAGVLTFTTIVDADIPAAIARDSEVTSAANAAQAAAEATAAAALTAHGIAADPHPGYTTAAELAAAVTAHEAAGDPHPGYTTAAELSTALGSYAPLAQLPTVGGDYANDAAAAGGGIAVGSLYHTSGAVKIRLA
jgi:hypothetical protein